MDAMATLEAGVPRMGEVISLREHLEQVAQLRENALEAKMTALADAVRAAQEQGSREHAEVQHELQGVRSEVSTLRNDVTQLQTVGETKHRLRNMDLAKAGVLFTVLATVVGYVGQH
jgi:chromosome segregation ATPase